MSNYGLDIRQLRRYVVRPTLEQLGLYSLAAERLVLGTGAHESQYRYIDQIDKAGKPGPAFGLWQTEGATHADLYRSFLSQSRRSDLKRRLIRFASWFSGDFPDPGEMWSNLAYACAVCRLVYYRVPAPLPRADDVVALAGYSKQYYNTTLGRATIGQYQQAIIDVIATETP